jgi:hypothetical protein
MAVYWLVVAVEVLVDVVLAEVEVEQLLSKSVAGSDAASRINQTEPGS